MVRISMVIPVYNEIRFIQKTLESVIGDADEIILSDNASTDGTSDICQSFADKYPEIKYTRHKENMGAINNHFFAWNQVSGKYIRNMGAHDMISIGSNQSMAQLLDKHPDVVMAYPKYVINLKEDYSVIRSHAYDDEFVNGGLSDSAYIRVKSMSNNKDFFFVFFGLWKTEDYLNFTRPRIFKQNSTDVAILLSSAAKGKFLTDEKSIFFRMNPHNCKSMYDNNKRYKEFFLEQSPDSVSSFWPFAVFAESYDIMLEKFGENPQFCEEVLQDILRVSSAWLKNEYKLEYMPSIIPEKLELCKNIINVIEAAKNRKVDAFYKISKTYKKIFLFGSGKTSHDAISFFPLINWSAFIENDNSKVGKPDILPIISFQEFIENSKDTLVLITSSLYGEEMKQQLIDNGFPEESVVVAY